ncbi:NADP-binding protein [Dacryopinax primogenitus]|uniref:NADP-binding protein n=1 Tax=Dacryopinax primogenitus (strain DJM 731) TaxID=1858805 RepID=M5G6J4_DACPD|nr:NADP-binding protein [Dacryopinax primogenitus]EJU05876.1 NADP-binding protein [Dacryopinax primogenitus]
MSPTVYLVSGANRGIGLGLVTSLATRANVIVFGGVRDPSSATDLKALQNKYPRTVHIVKLTSASRSDNLAAIEQIKRTAGRLDVVIANAGIAKFWGSILDTPEEEMREHYEVNVVGPTVLFQAAWPLLKKSTRPDFAIISSVAGSIAVGAAMPAGVLAYGASKAGANFLAMKLHSEHPELVVIPIHPGSVATDMGDYGKKNDAVIRELTFIPVEKSVGGILNVVDDAKRPLDGPKMISYDGSVIPW